MPSSQVVALRKAIRDGLKTALATAGPAGNQVQTEYGWPGDDLAQSERVFLSAARGDHKPASMRAGRTFRDERGELDVIVQVEYPGGDAESSDDRAIALGQIVEEWFADRTDSNGVPGISQVLVARWPLDNLYNANGSFTELVYTITWRARLQ